MRRYESFGPDAEILGQPMLAFLKSIHFENIKPILEKHSLTDIQPDKWYPQQTWLDVFNSIAEESGTAMYDFVSVGLKVIESAKLPPEIARLPFDQILLSWTTTFHLNNRGDDIGYFRGEKVGERHVKIVFRVAYPDDFVYGNFHGVAGRFLPPGTNFTIHYDEATLTHDQGGEETILHIKWDAPA